MVLGGELSRTVLWSSGVAAQCLWSGSCSLDNKTDDTGIRFHLELWLPEKKMPQVAGARKEGKWAVYTDSKVVIMKKRAT